MSHTEVSATQAVEVIDGLRSAGVRLWVIGGWGIDALIGAQTRAHHDLDLLVDVDTLPILDRSLRGFGFARAYEWDENRHVTLDGEDWDTAFVAQHPDGRELDIHGVWTADRRVRLATKDPWQIPVRWATSGSIDGRKVPCVTATAQRALHQGYEMPRKHSDDLRRISCL